MFTKQFWQAVVERMVRGAAVAVAGVYIGADVVFDSMNVQSWREVAAVALFGAFGSLVLSLTGQVVTGNGPSLTNQETLDPAPPPA